MSSLVGRNQGALTRALARQPASARPLGRALMYERTGRALMYEGWPCFNV
jgi:hypothetical protein